MMQQTCGVAGWWNGGVAPRLPRVVLAALLAGCAAADTTGNPLVPRAAVANVAVSPPAVGPLARGGTVGLTALVRDGRGNPLLDRPVTWNSANPTVATVSATGVVTAFAPGTTAVTATSEGVIGSAVVTVREPSAVVVSITPQAVTLNPGTVAMLSVQIAGGDPTPTLASCVSGASSVASVSVSGSHCTVTAVGSGSTTITAATSAGQSASAVVTVTQLPSALGQLTVSPATATLSIGQTIQLVPNPNAAGAAVNVLFGYTSSNSTIASTNAQGAITAHSLGTASITVTATGNGTGFSPATRSFTVIVNVSTVIDSTRFVRVDSVRPVFADRVGGAVVRAFGQNLGAVTTVTVGTQPATALRLVSPTALELTLPAQAAIGAQDLVVRTASGASATCAQCVIYFTPTIGLTPQAGPLTGGTTVTVTDVAAPSLITAVRVGTGTATGLTVLSPTSLRFVTPPATAAGAADVAFIYGARGGLSCPGCYVYEAVGPTLTGRFAGVVQNAVGLAPISGASVRLRRTDASGEFGPYLTAADGAWLSAAIPVGRYTVTVDATGFQQSTLQDRQLDGAVPPPTTTLPTVYLVPTGASSGTLTGTVRDATTNAVISGATVEVRAGGYNVTGTPLATVTSSATGGYSVPTLAAGTYTVRATKEGFSDGSVLATVSAATQTAPVLFLSPVGTNVAWRFVLSWGASPRDLDSHLTGPVPGATNRFHVYFSSRGSATALPFARLDVDVTTGFGPETITIAQQFPGLYRYYVYQWSSDGAIPTSNARVDVYQGNTLVRQFYPPQGTGRYWTVFEISGTTLTPVNTLGSTEPARQVGPVLQVDSPTARAAAEWAAFMPWQWRK
jgi:uncharacterized protein YfaP (DUF2135 family)/uncharacterized protein YjdB